jgi:hypothetical protein
MDTPGPLALTLRLENHRYITGNPSGCVRGPDFLTEVSHSPLDRL